MHLNSTTDYAVSSHCMLLYMIFFFKLLRTDKLDPKSFSINAVGVSVRLEIKQAAFTSL